MLRNLSFRIVPNTSSIAVFANGEPLTEEEIKRLLVVLNNPTVLKLLNNSTPSDGSVQEAAERGFNG